MLSMTRVNSRNLEKFFNTLDVRLYEIENGGIINIPNLVDLQPNTFDYFQDLEGHVFTEIIVHKKDLSMWRVTMNNWSLQLTEIKQRVKLYNLKINLDTGISDLMEDVVEE
jgi:hypothetical protein